MNTEIKETKNPSARKSRHTRRRAKQRAKKQELNLGVLPLRRVDGKTKDPTPHVASWDIVTGGGYLRLGEGFLIIEKDERDSYIDKVREYQEAE